jgi:DNA-binding NarL/FixJ family response regulator
VRKASPSVRILAYASYEDKDHLRQLFELGVVGYVLKRSPADDLIRAIQDVVLGGVYIDPAVAEIILSRTAKKRDCASGGVAELTEHETKVLKKIATGYLPKTVAADLNVRVDTVRAWHARGMQKLRLKSRVDLIRHAVQNSWFDQFGGDVAAGGSFDKRQTG